MIFEVEYEKILEKIHQVNPLKYAATRNYLDGSVTRLSPYISRGVISTKQILASVLNAGLAPEKIEKFIQELAWRDYWQQKWIANPSLLDDNLNPISLHDLRKGIPSSLLQHQSGIIAIDQGIKHLYSVGYMHNHVRMYVASVVCNVAQCHWKNPAQWMYYHLLDADWASNALSWQWVAGINSSKQYYANQENINKYCFTAQQNTFLDISYEDLQDLSIPEELHSLSQAILQTTLPQTNIPAIEPEYPTLVYNFYNLDPNWRNEQQANRILLLEPSVFEKYPVAEKSIDFCIRLAKVNIPNIQIWVGEFKDLRTKVKGDIYFKEHPFNNYSGCEDQRTWLSNVSGDFPSFFAFWKRVKKELF
jgi:deoxyribodipyrimidine photo-lyase